MFKRLSNAVVAALVLVLISTSFSSIGALPASAQAGCQTFTETGHNVCGRFLQYWQTHGGLAQQGYPIGEPVGELSSVDGRWYTVQYFERAVFEYHPENPAPNDVLLSLLGAFRYQGKYSGNAPGQLPVGGGAQSFSQTGKSVTEPFLSYWKKHGGLAQQGYPISNLLYETSDLDGQQYVVQYFERAVFELHPEFAAQGNGVLLSQLGTFRYKQQSAAS